MAIVALVILAITHAISDRSLDALFGVILGHTGIVAYNGATNTGANPTVTAEPNQHVIGQRKADVIPIPINGPQTTVAAGTPAGPPATPADAGPATGPPAAPQTTA